jgi:hypothetical protein
MKIKTKLRQSCTWLVLSRLLLWTPANVLQRSSTSPVKSLELFSKFQRQEKFFQLKVALVGVIGFATILGATSIPLQTPTEHKSTGAANFINYYSLALAVGHILLVILAILAECFQVCPRPFIFATISYVALLVLMSSLVFTRQMLDAQLYLTSMSLMSIVATVYFQESFLVSFICWFLIIIRSTIYLARKSEVEEVSLYVHACMFILIRCSYSTELHCLCRP